MKNFSLFILMVISVLGLTSCTSSNNFIYGSNEMTQEEEQRLVELARAFILRSKKIAKPEERIFISNNAPEVKADYDGYKTGKTAITWNTDQRRIVARLYGSMVGENHKWRISVYFKEDIMHTPRARVPNTPVKQGGVDDFADMFRKQAVKPGKEDLKKLKQ